MLSTKENIRAILECNFAGFKDEYIEIALDRIMEIIDDAPEFKITEEQAIDKLHETGWLIKHDKEMTERPQKVVTIPHELIEKLVLCVVDTVENIDWDKAIETYKERPHGKWIFSIPNINEIGTWKCSNCNNAPVVPELSNYCPNCGADMRGDIK